MLIEFFITILFFLILNSHANPKINWGIVPKSAVPPMMPGASLREMMPPVRAGLELQARAGGRRTELFSDQTAMWFCGAGTLGALVDVFGALLPVAFGINI